MLDRIKSYFGKPKQPPLDAKFVGEYSTAFNLGPVPLQNGAVAFGATGSGNWFSAASPTDRQVLMWQPPALLETDSLKVLQTISQARYAPHNRCVLYQPWRAPSEPPEVRWLGAMTPEMARPIGQAVHGSPIEHFYLITGGIAVGALNALSDALAGHQLQSLGLFWYFSGDDLTDEPRVLDELGALCTACGARRLSLLSAAIDTASEERLVDGLRAAPLLEECSVFEKDDQASYGRFRTPTLDTFLRERNS